MKPKKQQWYTVTIKATITKTQDIQATSKENAAKAIVTSAPSKGKTL